MASFSFISHFTLFILLLITYAHSFSETSLLSFEEQESTYKVLESINSETNWRSIFPDDLCNSGPHGLICDYFTDSNGNNGSYHITELNFGYISDYSANPICSSNASFTPHLTSFTHLRKLLFYKCFTETPISLPGYFSNLSSTLEELIFIENPSLFGSLSGKISSVSNLKKLVFTGTWISGEIPNEIGDLKELEQITLTRNGFNGEVPVSIGNLKKLKVLDLSFNGFEGEVPDSIGGNTELLKIDLGSNQFHGKIPESLAGLQKLEFLDLSYNRFGNYGVPLFLSEMESLREVYLSGNQLGGQVPEIWEKLGGILGLGLSGIGLVGKIPSSMGIYLKNISYLGLDNNTLEGTVPDEFGLLESVHELNLENNRLSGRVPFFSNKIGEKLKLKGNLGLCVDEGQLSKNHNGGLGYLKLCNKSVIPNAVLFSGSSSSSSSLVQENFYIFMFLFSFLFCLIFC